MIPGEFIAIITVGMAVVAGLVWISWRIEKKRIEALRAWVRNKGWTFKPDRLDSLEKTWAGIRHFEQGHSRYGCNWIKGRLHDRSFHLCEYHFAITTSNGKSTTTHHHWSTVAIIESAVRLSPLRIRAEHLLDKLAGLVGWHDIDTESDAFNRRFHVSAEDRRWACDALQPATLEVFLASSELSLECAAGAVVVVARHKLALEELERPLSLGEAFLDNLPSFLKDR